MEPRIMAQSLCRGAWAGENIFPVETALNMDFHLGQAENLGIQANINTQICLMFGDLSHIFANLRFIEAPFFTGNTPRIQSKIYRTPHTKSNKIRRLLKLAANSPGRILLIPSFQPIESPD
jgi:hypothetical protein